MELRGTGCRAYSLGIGNNKVFITGMPDTIDVLCSFDLEGNLLCQIEYSEEWHVNYTGSRSTPLVINNLVYFIAEWAKYFVLMPIIEPKFGQWIC